ncbi:hypothetical protein KGF56_002701 [Candida oxycetoniae]|uniref:Uncharacterized protein n=1 Tax=Candida oxycetoniae TaxID=497107 RepID=A0AAI9SWR2_9ASCO|nr:uncharacterized protein KGF56_002701 [Candida oxycetoniae]KAI3404509.2 hypothetical protein KGF56_002701 [Candida oxycetoniae]
MNTRPYIKSEPHNLGEPLPLTYISSSSRPNKAKATSIKDTLSSTDMNLSRHRPRLHQTDTVIPSQQFQQQNSNYKSSSNLNLVDRLMAQRSAPPATNSQQQQQQQQQLTRTKIKTKLRQLVHEFNDIETVDQSNLLLFDMKLNELVELVDQTKYQIGIEELEEEINKQEKENQIHKKEQTLSNKSSFENYSLIEHIVQNVYTFRYWIFFLATLIIIGLLSLSTLAEDFKYRYCYYFC